MLIEAIDKQSSLKKGLLVWLRPTHGQVARVLQTGYFSFAVRNIIMLKTVSIETRSEQETVQLGAALGRMLQPGDTILLIGDLGAGKTRLAKGIVSTAAAVSPDEVVSPSFTLLNRFEGDFPVHHADLYRLEPRHIEGIGLEEALEEGGAIVIEWAEKVRGLTEDPLTVKIEYASAEDSRIIVFQWSDDGSWKDRLDKVIMGFKKGSNEL